MTFKMLLLSLTVLGSLTLRAQEVTMDDPADEQRLNQAIWESVKGKAVPYAQVLEYVRRAQAASRKSSTVTLPNGWKIAPAGTQTAVGKLPFEAVEFGSSLVVINSGYSSTDQSISVVDPASGALLKTLSVPNLFPSAAAGAQGGLYVSAGYDNQIKRYDKNFNLTQTYTLPGYAGAVAAADNTHIAATYSDPPVLILRFGHVVLIDVNSGAVVKDTKVGPFEPYALLPAAGKYYASIPAANEIAVLDGAVNLLTTVTVGTAPQAMCTAGNLVYVVNSSSNSISVLDTTSDTVTATFSVRFLNQRTGAAPTSCAVDGSKLYVTLATADAVAILDRASGTLQGYIPTGYYPTKVLNTGDRLAVISAKGIQARKPNADGTYVLDQLIGSAGLVNKADIPGHLAAWTAQVLSGSPFSGPSGGGNHGIEHVFFLIKENRTYDQVLGDIGYANGDPSLVVFGQDITPIQHYVAKEFITFDNFFVDGEVSSLGHSYTASAYASPYLQVLTGLEYSGRLQSSSNLDPGGFSPIYLWDQMLKSGVSYRVFGEAVYFDSLYNLVVRTVGPGSDLPGKFNYLFSRGEKSSKLFAHLADILAPYADQAKTPEGVRALLLSPGFGRQFSQFFTGDDSLYNELQSNDKLLGLLVLYLSKYDFSYRVFDLDYSDLDRMGAWLSDFQAKDAAGKVESFQYLIVPNDHTGGSTWNTTQMVAQNDAAVDIFIRALAASKIWTSSLVLVVEDDAQSGLDHVDSTRTTAYVAGPRVKRNAVLNDQYDQSGMIRTIGLLTGIEPVCLNDAVAVPMFNIFSNSAPVVTYNPPPPSSQLAPDDVERYNNLLNQIGLKNK